MVAYAVSERHACRLMGLARSTRRYRSRKAERDAALRMRLKELVAQRMRFGYRRLTAMLVRSGMQVNHQRVYRLYREEGLAMRVRQRRRIRWNGALASPAAMKPNERWSIDFVSDCVSSGKVIRILTIGALAAWSEERRVRLEFIQPGKPVQNAYLESFNGRLRDECLNANWFTSLSDAKRKIESWRQDYNQQRPHSSLNYQPPSEFAQRRAEMQV